MSAIGFFGVYVTEKLFAVSAFPIRPVFHPWSTVSVGAEKIQDLFTNFVFMSKEIGV
jgi:hypothetical protein